MPQTLTRRHLLALTLLAACGRKPSPAPASSDYAGETPQMDALVRKYAQIYQIPESLIHRVIRRESGYNPRGPIPWAITARPQASWMPKPT